MESVRFAQSCTSNASDLPSYEAIGTTLPLVSRKSIITVFLILLLLYTARYRFLGPHSEKLKTVKKVRFEDADEYEYSGARSEHIKAQLEGTWHLESYCLELKGPVAITSHPFGREAKGRLIYTPDGHMSVNIMRPGCEPFRAANPHGGTVQENSSAAAHYMAYSGRYETFEHKGQKIIHHVLDSSLYPNWLETTQARLCELEGDELVLRPKKMPAYLVSD